MENGVIQNVLVVIGGTQTLFRDFVKFWNFSNFEEPYLFKNERIIYQCFSLHNEIIFGVDCQQNILEPHYT